MSAEDLTFTELVAICHEEGGVLSEDGLDTVYDILEHFASGGNVHNMEDVTPQEIVVFLGVTVVELRDAVLFRKAERNGE